MTTAPRFDCPLCEKGFAHLQSLAYHLWRGHAAHAPANGVGLHRGKSGRTIRCWCNRYFTLGAEPTDLFQEMNQFVDWTGEWARHLERQGGAAAHLLEIALNARHPKTKRKKP